MNRCYSCNSQTIKLVRYLLDYRIIETAGRPPKHKRGIFIKRFSKEVAVETKTQNYIFVCIAVKCPLKTNIDLMIPEWRIDTSNML